MMRRLAQVAAVVVSAYFALWACAPAAAMRPITQSLDQPNEFGGGATWAQPLEVSGRCAGELFACSAGINGQLWYQHRFGERFSLGGTLFGGQTSIVGGGALARFHLLETDRLHLGGDVSLGFAWAELGVPVALRVAGPVWIYTEPSLAYRFIQPVRLPLGVAVEIGDSFQVSAEASFGFDPFFNTTAEPAQSMYLTGSAGVGYRF